MPDEPRLPFGSDTGIIGGLISRAGTFWLYTAFGVVAMVVFHRTVSETKGRPLEEVELELGADTAAGGRHPAGGPR